jgi:plastocyanin
MTSWRSPRRLLISVALVVGLLPVAACGGGSGSSTSTAPGAVKVKDNVFAPTNTEVHAGDTVTWTWTGAADHNVTGPGFTSPTQGKGKTFSHTFTATGTVNYVCTIHQGMKGTIKVS